MKKGGSYGWSKCALPGDVLEKIERFWTERYESEYGYLFKSSGKYREESK